MYKFFIVLSLTLTSILAQPTYKIMSYNLLNYPGSDTTGRNPYFRTTIESVVPDILVVQEITSQAGVNGFLNNVLNVVSSGYAAGSFIDGPDTDNAIFYKTNSFTFLGNNPIFTSLRDISEFVLIENTSGDTIRIYSVHLKASSGSTNEQQRLAEVTLLRDVTDALPLNSNFIVCGDFNIYGSNEPAYLKLKEQTTQGYFIDIYNLTGTWNNLAYAPYHTQSPRVRQFGGGATGGLDDRFDMILMSQAVIDSGRIMYVNNSYTAYGNDGLHFNDSINAPPNNAVGQTIADALHYGSDHLPVFASFKFESIIPVEIEPLVATIIDNDVVIKWTTVTETNNMGFDIERYDVNWRTIGFIQGNGTTSEYHRYEFTDYDLQPGEYSYRIKQIDNDGSFDYLPQLDVTILPPIQFALYDCYPNPFNNSTVISWQQPSAEFVSIKVYDVLGNEVGSLVNEEIESGKHSINYVSNVLSSGVYFYRIQSGSFIDTKKMILLK